MHRHCIHSLEVHKIQVDLILLHKFKLSSIDCPHFMSLLNLNVYSRSRNYKLYQLNFSKEKKLWKE